MASLSTIGKYSIGGGLDAFRHSFGSACAELGHRVSPGAVQQVSNEGEMLQFTTILLVTCAGLENLALDLPLHCKPPSGSTPSFLQRSRDSLWRPLTAWCTGCLRRFRCKPLRPPPQAKSSKV